MTVQMMIWENGLTFWLIRKQYKLLEQARVALNMAAQQNKSQKEIPIQKQESKI